MIIYFILFCAVAFLSLVESTFNYKISKFWFYVISICILLIAGTRWYIGTDFNHYLNLYNGIKNNSFSINDIEISYFILSKITPNFQCFLMLYAFIACGLKLHIIKESNYKFSTLLLYLSFMMLSYDMGRIRQGIALSFCLLSIKYLKKDEFLKFVFTIIIAGTFHKASIVFFFAWFLRNKTFKHSFVYFVGIFSLLCTFFRVDLYISDLLNYIPILKKYSSYFTIGSEFSYFSFSLTNLRRIILLVIFTIFVDKKDKINNIMFNCFLMSTVIFYVFRDFPVISERVSYYFGFIEIFLIPQIFAKFKQCFRGIIGCFIVIYSLYYYLNILTLKGDIVFNQPYIAYQSWLFNRNFFSSSYNYILLIILLTVYTLFFYKQCKNKKNIFKIHL